MWFSRRASQARVIQPQSNRVLFEALEGRQMLSVSMMPRPDGQEARPPRPPIEETIHARVLDVITFAEAPGAVQAGLNARATAGGHAAFDLTTPIKLDNIAGTSLYCVRVGEEGAAPLRVDVNGAEYIPTPPADHEEPTTRPEPTETTFASLPDAAKTRIQSLADSHGVTEEISDTKTVRMLEQPNGVTLYTIALKATGENLAGESITFNLKITVDAAGNPTVLPHPAPPPPPSEDGSNGESEENHQPPPPPPTDSGNTDAGTGNEERPAPPPPHHHQPPSTDENANNSGGEPSTENQPTTPPKLAKLSSRNLEKAAKAVRAAMNGKLEGLAGAIAIFAPKEANEIVQADLEQIKSDRKALGDAVRALSSDERKTLRADEKAIRAAIRGLAETLTPLNETLKADIRTWKATLRADKKAIREAGNDAEALAAAKAQLATDQAEAFASISADLKAIQDVIDADPAIQAARAQLAADLPAIAAGQETLKADMEKLQNDVQAQLDEAAGT